MKKKWTGRVLFLLFFLFCITEIIAQNQENNLKLYKLINADTLKLKKSKGEYITNLSGNVHFFYGSTEFYADYAEVFEKQKITRMIGDVKVYEDTLSLFAEKVEYFRIPEIIKLNKNVFCKEVHSDSTMRTFHGDFVEYKQKQKILTAERNVRVYDEREQFVGTCNFLTYNRKTGYGYLKENPVLNINKQNDLKITAEKFEYFNEFKKVVATFNVNTKSSDYEIKSNFLLYFNEENKAIYQGNPTFVSEMSEATATQFTIFFENQKLSKAVLEDSCKVNYKNNSDDEKHNLITANQMEFFFKNGNLKKCIARQNVNSYHLQKDDSNKDFMKNLVKGNKLILKLEADSLDSINLFQAKEGSYYFEKSN